MAYLNENEIKTIGFKSLGKNVKISSKASFYYPELMIIGDESRIDDFCVLTGKIEIGNNVHVASFCNLRGHSVGIKIGDFSGLAYGVNVIAGSDCYYGTALTGPTVPSEFTNVTEIRVIIEKHVIIGINSVIMPGSKLKIGSSIMAMSLINFTTKPWTIYSGNPAKIISHRSDKLLTYEKKFLNRKFDID